MSITLTIMRPEPIKQQEFEALDIIKSGFDEELKNKYHILNLELANSTIKKRIFSESKQWTQ